MKYRELDSNGDYSFGSNRFLYDTQAVAQAVKTRLKLLYGEWWENTEDGLPLFEKILGVFGTDENKNAVDLIISERILDTEGVEQISSFESTFENRKYSAVCTITTVYGDTDVTISDNGAVVEVSY